MNVIQLGGERCSRNISDCYRRVIGTTPLAPSSRMRYVPYARQMCCGFATYVVPLHWFKYILAQMTHDSDSPALSRVASVTAAEAGERDDEIEITPEMIAAGCEEYALFDSGDPGKWVVWAVYAAMEKVRRTEAPSQPGEAT